MSDASGKRVTPLNDTECLNAILMQLRIIAYILREQNGIKDSDADFISNFTNEDITTNANLG